MDSDEEPQRCPVTPGKNSNLWGFPAPATWMEEASPFPAVTATPAMAQAVQL
jgi:hypothetical protein